MVKVEIYRNRTEGYDIIVLDTEQYLSSIVFDNIVYYLRSHLSNSINDVWFWDEDVTVASCLKYQGIAIQLFSFLDDRITAKKELAVVLQEALDYLDA